MSERKKAILTGLAGLLLLVAPALVCEGTTADAAGKKVAPVATSSAPVNGCVPGSEGPGWLCTKQGVPVSK